LEELPCLEELLERDFLLGSGDDHRLRFFFLLLSSLALLAANASAICLTLIPGAGLLGSSGNGTHLPLSLSLSLSSSLPLSES